jgi:hypothetical protein
LTDSGTIGGGSMAVQLTGADELLRVAAGAYFNGMVNGGGGTLKLVGTDGAGTFSGLGSGQLDGSLQGTFSNFSAYVIGGTGTWTMTGTNTLGPSTDLRVNGTLTVDGGRFEDQSALGGIGTLAVSSYGTLQFDAGVASTTTIAFADTTGSVVLDDPSATGLSFAGVIAGFSAGDQIELQTLVYSTGMALDWIQTSGTEGVLTVQEPASGPTVSLTLAGTFQTSDFAAYASLTGGTSIVEKPAPGSAAALFGSGTPMASGGMPDALRAVPAPGGASHDAKPDFRPWAEGVPLGHDA